MIGDIKEKLMVKDLTTITTFRISCFVCMTLSYP